MFFSKFFKKKYPYAPIAYLGRKTVERTLDANIRKLKKVEKEIGEEQLQKQDKIDVDASKSKHKNGDPNNDLHNKSDVSKNQKKAVEKSTKEISKKSKK